MARIVVSIRRPNDGAGMDVEVPTDLGASQLVVRLADSLGAPTGGGPFELRASALGRALEPDETLADAGLWDGTLLVLARAGDPHEPTPRPVLALARLPDQARLPAAPEWQLASGEAERSHTRLLVGGALLLLLVVVGAGVWFMRPRESPATVAATAEAPVVAITPGPQVAAEPTVNHLNLTLGEAAPTATPGAAITEETTWRELQPQLDTLWGLDWPSAIALLQSFHSQYPTRTTATEKLYAAMIEYGRALREAGANGAAADTLGQAVKLAPQRLEARVELAALTPVAEPVAQQAPPPEPIVQPQPIARPVAQPTPVLMAPPPQPPTPTSVAVEPVADQPPGCDVQDMEAACPLADGARLENAVELPSTVNYYWFGVPAPNMRVRVEVVGRAAPFALLLFSDQSADPTAPITWQDASSSGTTILDWVLPNTGAYVLALVPQADAASAPAPDLRYTLAFDLQPLPTPMAVVEQPTPLPTPAPTATPVPLVAVPPLAARTASIAADRLRQAGLIAQFQSADRFSAGGAGTVALQDPPAGSSVPVGSVVVLSIATGNVVVPSSAIGLAEDEAANTLRQAGVVVEIRRAHRSGVAAGRAADLNPPGGAVVEAGAVVVVTISQGE